MKYTETNDEETRLFDMGLYYQENGLMKNAIEAYDQVIKMNPDSKDAYFNKAICLTYLGEEQAASSCYQKVIELDPTDTEALYYKARTILKLGNTEEALSLYNKVIELDPKHINAYQDKAYLLARLGGHTEEEYLCYAALREIDSDDNTHEQEAVPESHKHLQPESKEHEHPPSGLLIKEDDQIDLLGDHTADHL